MKNKVYLLFFLFFSLRAYSQSCTLTVNITASNTAICSGNPVVLTAVPSAGTPPYIYAWSTGETAQSINVNKVGTYTVTVSDQTAGCPPVTKSIAITSGTAADAPTAADAITCFNTSATLTATAPGGTYQWYDAPVGGNFLATGATYNTPPITVKTIYYVQTTLSGCASARTAVTAYPIIGPTVTDKTTCAGSSATLTATGEGGYQWYDAPAGGNLLATGQTFTTPALFANTVYYVIGLTNGCISQPSKVNVYVTPVPPAPAAAAVTTCSGSVANLHATGPPGAIFDWFNVPDGGISLISSPDYTTPVLTANTTYYVQATVNGCISSRTAVPVTVNPIPSPPVIADVTVCSGNSAALTPTAPGGIYQWYASATGTTLLATGNTHITPVLNTSTVYYVQVVNGGCTSARTPVSVTVNASPTAPIAAGQTICSGSAATLTAIGPGGSYEWYDAATGGNLLFSGAAYTTPVLAATTAYYVQTTMGGCTSPRTAVTVTINPAPAAPTANGVAVCSGSSATLSASGTGSSYEWYSAATGGNLLASTQSYITPPLSANTTYYVQNIANGCISPRIPVKVTINPLPAAPTASGTTICSGSSAVLTANAAAGTIQWFDAAAGGNLLITGNTYNTPALSATTTYYIQTVNGGCASNRNPVTVTVIPIVANQFKYSSGTYCTSGANPTPVITGPTGGTFSASPAGLVFVSTATGQINLAASLPGKYNITFTGSCYPSTVGLAIVAVPDAGFAYIGTPYCQGAANPSPVFTTGSAGVFSASPAGLIFVNNTTGQIDLNASTPGTYTITNTINVVGGCPATTATATVTIDQNVTVSAGPNQTVAVGTPVQLAGNISGGATTGTWSGGAGFFSNNSSLNVVYTPGASESGAVMLTLTSANPGNSCGAKSSTVVITFNNVPGTPTASGSPVCSGSAATLTATAPGGTYQWYDAATAGNLLTTGATYTTPVLNASTTYYVQTTVNGITSARTTVAAMVNSIPTAPIVPALSVCPGNAATLTATGSAGTYQWYDALTGGNFLGAGNNFTTPFLTANTSYYVQTTVNGCISPRTQVDVTVNPVPAITSAATSSICSGNAQNYIITADMAGTTFTWSRAAIAGINNAAIANQTFGTITESLINTTGANIDVTYVITPLLNGCSGVNFNYVVTVSPVPVITSPAAATVCSGSSVNYNLTFNTAAGTAFSWGRAAVAGISNAAVAGQTSSGIQEVLFNTISVPVDVTYVFTYNAPNCGASVFNLVVTVDPKVDISSDSTGVACSGIPQNYTITSNVATAVYTWSRQFETGISNAAGSGNTSGPITEALINTTNQPVTVNYSITTTANGCQAVPFNYVVMVYPQPRIPIANSNSPVCTGSTIDLLTPTIFAGGTYLWTGPDGFTSTLQNPSITNVTAANAGTYNLYVITNGCSSAAATVDVAVDKPPVVNAGPDQIACITTPSITLAGSVSGGTTTGIWITSGTGTFSPSANQLNAQYLPSAQDRNAGMVTLTLASTSRDNCNLNIDEMVIKFQPIPATDAGPDQSVCSQTAAVALQGNIFIPGNGTWSTSGSGTFSPSAMQIKDAGSPVYIPSAVDITNGSVILTLTANAVNSCYIPSDQVVIKLLPPPKVYAGGTRYVLKGNTIVLNPIVNEGNMTYLWAPNVFIDDNTKKNPTITGDVDRVYTLQVTDSLGCVATDQASIIVSPPVIIPNTFTPNGDGINDIWQIPGLMAYPNATVDIFDRYGQKIFHTIGYGKPWDGTYNGKQLPAGTYYYVIDAKIYNRVYSGYVAILR